MKHKGLRRATSARTGREIADHGYVIDNGRIVPPALRRHWAA
jgi:hypothetical protein